ncbi:phosphotransferase family protein [Alicyclobacillus tolerans]|uniref:phosphotransferase family protein n=1 Tax=Alicyclobacillus tolerans TaxID=90970 RepID=UPI001F183716|nr:phosphotransferase family protein [Alicyclobacillus tolerans]MCF8565347.1 phosphotransferase family protein [Alicyclobacillus tolerans]
MNQTNRNVPGTIPVRPGEEFDTAIVKQYLSEHVPDLPDEPLEVVQFPSGASNLTYLLRIGEWQAVMRRPPLGPLPPKAHDMKRESEFLKLLNPVFPLAPKPHVFCEDAALIGTPFYVMEYRTGVVLDGKFPESVHPTPETCQNISYAVADTLAQLHQVSIESSGLSAFGHPQGFMERQVKGWIERYQRAKTDDVPTIDPIASWLVEKLPASPPATVIHNDFKLNNMLLSSDLSKVDTVVDWEMATIGDPLMDLAIALGYWVEPDDPASLKQMLPAVTTVDGFLSRADMLQRYAVKSGRDVSNMDFYMVFAYFKLSVILQQIYVRWRRGQTQDPRFEHFGKRVNELVAHAQRLIDGQPWSNKLK